MLPGMVSHALVCVIFQLRSPFDKDVRLCNETDDWRTAGGNEMSLVWTPSASNAANNKWIVITYMTNSLGGEFVLLYNRCKSKLYIVGSFD